MSKPGSKKEKRTKESERMGFIGVFKVCIDLTTRTWSSFKFVEFRRKRKLSRDTLALASFFRLLLRLGLILLPLCCAAPPPHLWYQFPPLSHQRELHHHHQCGQRQIEGLCVCYVPTTNYPTTNPFTTTQQWLTDLSLNRARRDRCTHFMFPLFPHEAADMTSGTDRSNGDFQTDQGGGE